MSSELAAAYNTVVSNAFKLPKINSFFFALFDMISQFFARFSFSFVLHFYFWWLHVILTIDYLSISVISILDWDIVKIL